MGVCGCKTKKDGDYQQLANSPFSNQWREPQTPESAREPDYHEVTDDKAGGKHPAFESVCGNGDIKQGSVVDRGASFDKREGLRSRGTSFDQSEGNLIRNISASLRNNQPKNAKQPTRSSTYELYEDTKPEEVVPSIGGLRLQSPVAENVLPPEVMLHVPGPDEVMMGPNRMIFLNTPLTDKEQERLSALHALCKSNNKTIPRCMRPQTLRAIQQAKGDVQKALSDLENKFIVRMQRLPINEEEVLPDLKKGFMYWHGRDRRCRPILVIRAKCIDADLMAGPQRVVRLITFLLEYMLRYGMCPGRVENWGLMVDLEKAGQHGRPSISFLKLLADALQSCYRFRMSWTRILNNPFWFQPIWGALCTVIPGESIKKIEIISSRVERLQELVDANQLEQRYGGSRPNRENPGDFVPMRFLPGPFEAGQTTPPNTSPDACRLHTRTPIDAHEGCLLEQGCEEMWLPTVQQCSLTPEASGYLESTLKVNVRPCVKTSDLLQLWPDFEQESKCADSEVCVPVESKRVTSL